MSKASFLLEGLDPSQMPLPESNRSSEEYVVTNNVHSEPSNTMLGDSLDFDHLESPRGMHFELMYRYDRNTLEPQQPDDDSLRKPASPGVESILEQQLEILRRINDRQTAAAEAQSQPVPPLSAKSSSAWGALLRSVKENIEPNIERWRSGLDALLVFIGLFSAVVTAFFVEWSQRLEQDPAEKTNQILSNLTEIYLSSNNLTFSTLNLPYDSGFTPDSKDIRLNTYWSVSLVSSISLAALAVTARRLLSSLTKTQSVIAPYKRVSEILLRWKSAESTLSFVVEALPQLMVIPVILFLGGLLDLMFSTASDRENPTRGRLSIALALSILSLSMAVLSLVYLIADRVRVNQTSTPLSSILRTANSMIERLQSTANVATSSTNHLLILPGSPLPTSSLNQKLSFMLRKVQSYLQPRMTQDNSSPKSLSKLTDAEHMSFHNAIQMTHDDDQLDQAAACLQNVLEDADLPGQHYFPHCSKHLDSTQLDTICYLLTSEASLKSNRTAANALHAWYSKHDLPEVDEKRRLLEHLTSAGNLYASHFPESPVYNNPFLEAIDVLARDRDFSHMRHYPNNTADRTVLLWQPLISCGEGNGVEDIVTAFIWPLLLGIDRQPGSASGSRIESSLWTLIQSYDELKFLEIGPKRQLLKNCISSLCHFHIAELDVGLPFTLFQDVARIPPSHVSVVLQSTALVIQDLITRGTLSTIQASELVALYGFSGELLCGWAWVNDAVNERVVVAGELLKLLLFTTGENGTDPMCRTPTQVEISFCTPLRLCLNSIFNITSVNSSNPTSDWLAFIIPFEKYLKALDPEYFNEQRLRGYFISMCNGWINEATSIVELVTTVMKHHLKLRLPNWCCTPFFQSHFYPLSEPWDRWVTNNPTKLPEYPGRRDYDKVIRDPAIDSGQPVHMFFVNHDTKTTTWENPENISVIRVDREDRLEGSIDERVDEPTLAG